MRTLFIAPIFVLASTAAHAAPFVFQVPPGWVDLSPGAPETNFARLPPLVTQQIRSGGFAFYAADLDHADDGFMENVNVTLDKGVEPITQKLIDDLATQLGGEIAKQAAGEKVQILDKRIVDVGGVHCGRIILNLDGPIRAKQVQYLMPGSDSHAVVTYSTVPEQFARYEPVFDFAAHATTGLAEPSSGWDKIGRSAGRGALIGGVAGGVAAILAGIAAMLRRRKKDRT